VRAVRTQPTTCSARHALRQQLLWLAARAPRWVSAPSINLSSARAARAKLFINENVQSVFYSACDYSCSALLHAPAAEVVAEWVSAGAQRALRGVARIPRTAPSRHLLRRERVRTQHERGWSPTRHCLGCKHRSTPCISGSWRIYD
jgi:hypothetical protein